MDETTTTLEDTTTAASTASTASIAGVDVELVEAELLVEEISIDGMCGVY